MQATGHVRVDISGDLSIFLADEFLIKAIEKCALQVSSSKMILDE